MESKFSIQKLDRRVKKYIWQPSTEEGNPLYSKGIDNEAKPIINKDIVFGEDKEFKNIINSKFSSPNNIRALFLFDNLGITVLHHGLGNDIKIKADGGYDIKYGDSELVLYSKKVSPKNLIKIGKGKDQAPDKLMFGTVNGATTDNQDNSTENFEYEEIKAITDTYKMPISMLNKWQMLNIEELYFDIMYTLNDLKGKVGDKKIDINEVAKTIFKVNDINEINNIFPRLKYIGFVNHSKELNELIKDRSRGENGKGLIAQVEKAQQNKEKSIIEQIPVLLGSLDRTNTLELKGNTTGKYGYNIKDWAYDYVFIKCNEKAEQKENKIQKQKEEDLGLRDITGKFKNIWEHVGKKLYKEKYPTDKSKNRVFAIVQLPAEDKCYFIQEEKKYYLNTRDIMPSDNKEPLGNGDCMMCLYKNGEPYTEKIGLITDKQLNEYYEEYVAPSKDLETFKEIVNRALTYREQGHLKGIEIAVRNWCISKDIIKDKINIDEMKKILEQTGKIEEQEINSILDRLREIR